MPSATLLKAKQDAEGKGYVFLTSHDEIVARAKKEGKLRVFSSQEPPAIKAIASAFKQKYPFIDVQAQELIGMENYQRALTEMKAGFAKWDVNYLAADYYPEYLPYQKKFDILGMAEQGVLRMEPKLIDPVNRHVVAIQSNMQVVAYQRDLTSAAKVPDTWEGILRDDEKRRPKDGGRTKQSRLTRDGWELPGVAGRSDAAGRFQRFHQERTGNDLDDWR